MVSYTQFTADFPELSNPVQYPLSSFNFALNYAAQMLTNVWGPPAGPGQPNTAYDIGCELFVAHYMTLQAQNAQAVAAGGTPGGTNGPVSSQSVDGVSVSYDTSASMEEGAGQWNLTVYGRQFIQMAQMMGSGPTQVGPLAGYDPLNGPAWTGPCLYPGWFGN